MMVTLTQLAAHLDRAALELKFALDREIRLAMEAAALEAKAMIGHDNPNWPPLAESTIDDKARKGFGVPDPLLRSGELRRSIEAETESVGMFNEGAIGSNDPVAKYQELGTSKIPPRPFLSAAMTKTIPLINATLGELATRAMTPGSNI